MTRKTLTAIIAIFIAALAYWFVFDKVMSNGKEIVISEAYARSNSPSAPAAAVYMIIKNNSGRDDKLIAVRSDVALMAELHTNIESDDGVMMMRTMEEGYDLPARGEVQLARGGHHIMLMGLNKPLEQGDVFDLTVMFQNAPTRQIQVVVDHLR